MKSNSGSGVRASSMNTEPHGLGLIVPPLLHRGENIRKHFYFSSEIVYVPDGCRVRATSIDLERSISEDKADVDFEGPQIDFLRRVNALRDPLFNLPKCSVMPRSHRDLHVAIRQWRAIRNDNHLIV